MRRLPLLALLSITACAGGGGTWPTLAHRPIEGPTTSVGPRRCALATPPSCLPPEPIAVAPSTEAPMPPVAIDDLPAKLAVIDRDLNDAAARLAAQRDKTVAAATAARGSPPQSDIWAKAETERTALDRIGNQVGDIRDRLNAVAGTLAAAGVGGTDVAAPMATTGRLIARTNVLQIDYESAVAALR